MTTPTTIAGLTVTVDMCRRLARAAARSLERPTIRLALPLTLVILLLVGCAPAAQITDEDFLSGARGLESFSAETDAELVAAGEGLCESLFEAGGDHEGEARRKAFAEGSDRAERRLQDRRLVVSRAGRERESECGGAGKFRSCKSQPGAGVWSYNYSYDHFVTNRKGMTPKRVMDIFKDNAQTVFPFDVEGCSAFTNGAECDLKTGTLLLNPNGVVGVTTTDTSVKFTVIERGYFDAPGSTIEFSVTQRADGIYLSQSADAFGADAFTALGLGVFRSALPTWEEQARNLTALVESEG